MSQCVPRRAFKHSIIKVVALLIQPHGYLPSATNGRRTSHSFHILGNPCLVSSMKSGFGGNLTNAVFTGTDFLCWFCILTLSSVLAHPPDAAENNSASCCY